MIDGVVGEFVGNGLAAHDASADGVDAVGLDVFDVGEMDAVFVAEREIREQIFKGIDAALGEEFGTLRADAFDHADFGGEGERHQHFFISFLRRTYRAGGRCTVRGGKTLIRRYLRYAAAYY